MKQLVGGGLQLAHLLDDASAHASGRARTLVDLLAPYPLAGIERSFKCDATGLQARRFLLASSLLELPPDFLARLPAALAMPAAQRELFERHRERCNFLYLGFGEDGGRLAYKVYLEFPVRLRATHDGPLLRVPATQALGFKWDPDDAARQAVARYDLLPGLSLPEMLGRLAEGPRESAAAMAVLALGLQQAAQRAGHADFDFISVSEPGAARASCDINLYAADLPVAAIAAQIEAFWRTTGQPEALLQQHLQRVSGCRLGHLSAGIGRDGKAFVTVYHGV